jgi:hypothetical protein
MIPPSYLAAKATCVFVKMFARNLPASCVFSQHVPEQTCNVFQNLVGFFAFLPEKVKTPGWKSLADVPFAGVYNHPTCSLSAIPGRDSDGRNGLKISKACLNIAAYFATKQYRHYHRGNGIPFKR